MTAYAFQCQDCGHLEEGPQAGTFPVPINCRHCDIGSHLEEQTVRMEYDKDAGEVVAVKALVQVVDRPNRFTILADLPESEQGKLLKKYANPGDRIVRYDPKGGKK